MIFHQTIANAAYPDHADIQMAMHVPWLLESEHLL
jgi:hypothetical protein